MWLQKPVPNIINIKAQTIFTTGKNKIMDQINPKKGTEKKFEHSNDKTAS